MNLPSVFRRWPIIATLWLAACAGTPPALQEAEQRLASGNYEAALALLNEEARTGRTDPELRAALVRTRSAVSERLIREARNATDLDRLDEAEKHYRRLIILDPGHAAAAAELDKLQARRSRDTQIARAEELLRTNQTEAASRLLQEVLAVAPRHRKAQKLVEQLGEMQRSKERTLQAAAPEFSRRVSLEFREVSLKAAFDVIWNASGINFILDREVKPDQKVSIFVREVTAEEAIDALLATQQLARKLVSSKTLLIYPKTPQKLAEYQELVVRNFFLAHADAKQIQSMLKSVIKVKEIFVDEKRNLIVVRDSQEQVDLASKLIQAHDQAEPEVMLALDVIEIRRTKLDELGLALPSQISFGVANPLSLATLRNLGAAGINVGFSGAAGANMLGTLNLQKSDSDANMLANPRIRVRNREKAKIHIGDRLPVVTTTSSSTSSFVGETVSYLDVGLKLEVEPQVMLDDQVVVKVNLEVSSATQSTVNSKFYDIGTRNTNTVLTIRDGETQVLAGLIRDDERDASSRLPGLGDIPVLGRLFASERREQDKTEIILAITPQVITNLSRPPAALIEYAAGTESGGRPGSTAAAAPTSGTENTTTAPAPRPQPATSSTGYPAPAVSSAPASTPMPTPAPNSPSSSGSGTGGRGVIPLIEFDLPPGVGSPSPQ